MYTFSESDRKRDKREARIERSLLKQNEAASLLSITSLERVAIKQMYDLYQCVI